MIAINKIRLFILIILYVVVVMHLLVILHQTKKKNISLVIEKVRRYDLNKHDQWELNKRKLNYSSNLHNDPAILEIFNNTKEKLKMNDFHVYIYDLPAVLNTDLLGCRPCSDSSNLISGINFKQEDGVNFRNTYQGSLEVYMHQRLEKSHYRTVDPYKANAFYIPYYFSLSLFCNYSARAYNHHPTHLDNVMYDILQKYPFYKAGKPHFMTASFPEVFTPVRPKHLLNITLIVLEKDNGRARPYQNLPKVIVAPYPSTGHFTKLNGGQYIDLLNQTDRPVSIFLAANNRTIPKKGKQPPRNVRNDVIDLFGEATSDSLEEYYANSKLSKYKQVEYIRVKIKPCKYSNMKKLLDWMKHSMFCLEPPGDSMTRKGFYDALFAGCVPVLFKIPNVPSLAHTTYPFEEFIDYSKFTVTISNISDIYNVIPYLESIKKDSYIINQMQIEIKKVLRYLQYNDLDENIDAGIDAFDMILYKMKNMLCDKK